MIDERFKKQMRFIVEIDKLKKITRQNFLIDGSRNENDVEHSWHLAMMALLLEEYANEPVDILKVVKMVLIHDIVEIDAGDTFAYDYEGAKDKEEREQKAADRLFGILPEDMEKEYRSLWDEFEEAQTNEAKFARALDRFQPMMNNYEGGGGSWKVHNITKDMVLKRNAEIEKGSKILWKYAQYMMEKAEKKGLIK